MLGDLGQEAASYKTMGRTLARAQERGYRDLVAGACFEHAVSTGDVSLIMYDVTTLYFEAEKEDDLRKVGYSKERRVDPQIVVGLLVDGVGSRWRSAASRETRQKRPRSCRSSRPSRPGTPWPTWSSSPTPGCSLRTTSKNWTRPTCGSSSARG
ncbi:hypothetical protein [Ornithinimicrobium flavum]|uniref:hypothetical protein n=1 Tax=Ornithinimicrobium flavum TaxID=1288636 RepID=UPI003B82D201